MLYNSKKLYEVRPKYAQGTVHRECKISHVIICGNTLPIVAFSAIRILLVEAFVPQEGAILQVWHMFEIYPSFLPFHWLARACNQIYPDLEHSLPAKRLDMISFLNATNPVHMKNFPMPICDISLRQYKQSSG